MRRPQTNSFILCVILVGTFIQKRRQSSCVQSNPIFAVHFQQALLPKLPVKRAKSSEYGSQFCVKNLMSQLPQFSGYVGIFNRAYANTKTIRALLMTFHLFPHHHSQASVACCCFYRHLRENQSESFWLVAHLMVFTNLHDLCFGLRFLGFEKCENT